MAVEAVDDHPGRAGRHHLDQQVEHLSPPSRCPVHHSIMQMLGCRGQVLEDASLSADFLLQMRPTRVTG
ncbi:hypothetical protein [Dactylosporangium cerinum]